MTMSIDPRAPVITCYGYRPESGSSMTAANLAWLLAGAGKRVVLMDWDFEAPTQQRYLRPFLPDPELGSQEGLLDLLVDHMTRQAAQPADAPAAPTALHALRYVVSCDWEFPDGGTLDLMPAGRTGPGYAVNASAFDWEGFFGRYGGAAFLASLKETLRDEYDYVLIDAPSGNDFASTVCLQYLSDRVVLCTRLDAAAVDESAGLIQWVRERNAAAAFFPLPTRVGTAEAALRDAALRHAMEALCPLTSAPLADEYFMRVVVPEVRFFEAREVPPALVEGHAARGITAAHAVLVEYLTGGAVRDPQAQRVPREVWLAYGVLPAGSLHKPAFSLREIVELDLDERLAVDYDKPLDVKRRGDTATPPQPPPTGDGRVRIFVSYSHRNKKYVGDGSLLGHLRLLEAAGLATFWYDEAIAVGNRWDDEIRAEIKQCDIALVLVSQQFLLSPYIQKVEISGFLEECEARGMIIFPVMLSACAWEQFDWLKGRKFIPEGDRNFEQHYNTSSKRTPFFQDVYDALKKQVEACRNGQRKAAA